MKIFLFYNINKFLNSIYFHLYLEYFILLFESELNNLYQLLKLYARIERWDYFQILLSFNLTNGNNFWMCHNKS
jgi:hypothetical protein